MTPHVQSKQVDPPRDSDPRERSWLVFRLGPHVMCASALDVEGIIERPRAITTLPVMPEYALGAFLFRDHSAIAISLRKKLKVREGEDSAKGPFIVARVRDAIFAFWVDEVKDVI
jgi:chemotaxis signal transduction protein